ncbi:MAG TPA: hypothetical protein VFN56_00945 [Candidatus Saccharimonadales bacterium]|nr:hypothetical protein [Candidatus Saccharimonadales bacterium]
MHKNTLTDEPLISVNEARKLIGMAGDELTNDELLQLISSTETVVRSLIRTYLRSKSATI